MTLNMTEKLLDQVAICSAADTGLTDAREVPEVLRCAFAVDSLAKKITENGCDSTGTATPTGRVGCEDCALTKRGSTSGGYRIRNTTLTYRSQG